MAISGGTYKADNSNQQSFKTDMKTQNEIVNDTIKNYGYVRVEYDTVGVTPDMLNNITNAIDNYISNLTATLDAMPSAVDYTQAFKGDEVHKAVEEFVTSVKEICKSYLNKLQEAEKQIINSVNEQYKTSDSELSSQLRNDSSSITPNNN